MKKYGTPYYVQSEQYREILKKRHEEEFYKRCGASSWREALGEDFCNFKETFSAALSRVIGTNWGWRDTPWAKDQEFVNHINSAEYLSLVSQRSYTAKAESEIIKRLEAEGFAVAKGRVGRLELDIFLPELSVAFELNGYPYHTAVYCPKFCHEPKAKNYHEKKTEAALSQGIKLYHLWYSRFEQVDELWNIVKTKLGLGYKVSARACKVTLDGEASKIREFLSQNHLLGKPARYDRSISLSYREEIVAVLTFDRNVNNRLCFKRGVAVAGGFQRMMKYVDWLDEVITYCDRDLSPDYENTVYYKNGWKLEGKSGVQLRYYDLLNDMVLSRWSCQIKVLKEKGWFVQGDTEQSCLVRNSIYPIYNSGCWKFSIKLR